MKTVTTTAAFATMLAIQRTNGFAPPSPRVHTAARASGLPSNFWQRQMVMGKFDPLSPMENETKTKENRVSTEPTPFFVSLFQDKQSKTNMKFAAAMMALALAFMPFNADAAMSGGRMGGSFSSSPSSSRSYSAPSSSYSRGYSSGYSSGYYSRPSVSVTPGFGYSPFMTPFPGYIGGPGVITYSRGPSFFDLIFFGGLAFVLVNIFRNAGSATSSSTTDFFDSDTAASALGSGTSVVQMSVALEVPNRDDPNSILAALGRLSNTARTDSRVGIQNLSSQVALELLRRRSSIVSAASSYKHFRDRTKAGRDFQSRSVQQRSKFEKETVSKFGGVDYSSQSRSLPSSDPASGKATMAVVTLVLAIDGDSTKLPRINSISDVEEALRKIASDVKVDDCLQSAEILWTPEDRTETLSLRDVIADYPDLRSV